QPLSVKIDVFYELVGPKIDSVGRVKRSLIDQNVLCRFFSCQKAFRERRAIVRKRCIRRNDGEFAWSILESGEFLSGKARRDAAPQNHVLIGLHKSSIKPPTFLGTGNCSFHQSYEIPSAQPPFPILCAISMQIFLPQQFLTAS